VLLLVHGLTLDAPAGCAAAAQNIRYVHIQATGCPGAVSACTLADNASVKKGVIFPQLYLGEVQVRSPPARQRPRGQKSSAPLAALRSSGGMEGRSLAALAALTDWLGPEVAPGAPGATRPATS
jgi:hypothetical protein